MIERIEDEAARAEFKFGPFRSTHEGYGVLAEEVAELFDAIRANNVCAIRDEAIQVAAVALRIAEACQRAHETKDGEPDEFTRRSLL